MPTHEPVTAEHGPGGSPQAPQVDDTSTPTVGPGAHSSGLAIIASKIAPATRERSVMARPRLIDWFALQSRARLMLVSAEAGYGKSTLLTDHSLGSGPTCVWYRMESSDGDWITFLSYMVASLREVFPDFGHSTEALLRNVAAMGSSRDVVLGQFLAELGSLEVGDVDVILDDFHLVEESADVRMILSRLLERGPDGMRLILAGRGRPNLALGRLLAQGRVAELTIDDLRFNKAEIEELFETTYGQPLSREACGIVAERTEGWAASLQLVSTSIAVSRPSEVGAFIEALDGAKGPIYDFLAEEVLTRLTPQTQRILTHASLIDRVRPELVSAALSVLDDAPAPSAVVAALDDAQTLGLLSDRRAISGGRIHPLFRQFLAHHLDRDTPQQQLLQMHLAIAKAAEPLDWLVAAKHYALAGEPQDGMRVLGSAASEALGTGAWGAAVQIVELMSDTAPPPAVEVVKARALVSDGRPNEAIELLRSLRGNLLTPEEHGLIALTLAAAYHLEGRGDLIAVEIRSLAEEDDIPSPLREVAQSWAVMLDTYAGGSIAHAVESLARLAVGQRRAGLHYFTGVTLHNTAYAELARAKYGRATRLASQAISELELTDEGSSILSSTRSIVATCAAEGGDVATGLESAYAAATEPGATADAIAEAAYIHAVSGHERRARALLAEFDRGEARWSRELSSRAQASTARFALAIGDGDLQSARAEVIAVEGMEAPELDWRSRLAVMRAIVAVTSRSDDAGLVATAAVDVAASQHAWRWMARARVLQAIAESDARALSTWLDEGAAESALMPLELADAIAAAVDLVLPLPDAVEHSIIHYPQRWTQTLRRQVQHGTPSSARAAAQLLSQFGTLEDAQVLRKFDRSPTRRTKRKGLAARLVRRLSPTVRVHDLGPTSIEVGSRLVTLTETRRKPAALLLYLVTRPDFAAPREQAMENLWPDQSPGSSVNSLHQTLFFLRRDIEPWHEDGLTADYVRMESDMVFLDTSLFQVDSVAFARQAKDIVATGAAATRGPEMLGLYRGSFAPEFEYEEWASEWRAHLHGIYLHLAHLTVEAMVGNNRLADAIDVLHPVVTVDPAALELRATLVACLAALGSTDAAQAHYRSLADLHERDLGAPAPTYAEIVARIDRHA